MHYSNHSTILANQTIAQEEALEFSERETEANVGEKEKYQRCVIDELMFVQNNDFVFHPVKLLYSCYAKCYLNFAIGT